MDFMTVPVIRNADELSHHTNLKDSSSLKLLHGFIRTKKRRL